MDLSRATTARTTTPAPSQKWLFVWPDILVPLLVTRLAQIIIGWGSVNLTASTAYEVPEAVARGWLFSPLRPLDIWGRWDATWYMGLVQYGYTDRLDMANSHIDYFAFYPLYPFLVRLFTLPLPGEWQNQEVLLFAGVVLSNLLLTGALVLLHKFITETIGDRSLARRTILYLLVFPTAFYFSAFYTESTYLFVSVAAFYAATRRIWWLAGIAGCFLALTRPTGVLIALPLAIMYMESINWKVRKIRPDVLYVALAPVGLLIFFAAAYLETGDFLRPLHAQAAWEKHFAWPLETLLHPFSYQQLTTPIDQVMTIVFLGLAVLMLRMLPSIAYFTYALLIIVPPLFTGTLQSVTRYYVVIFPAFIVLAMLGKSRRVNLTIIVVFWALQVLLMALWSQFYLIV